MLSHALSDYLARNHAQYSTMPHPVAFTAQEEAAAAHVPGIQWAKTVVCFADDQPILAVLPAPFDVDLNALRRAADAASIRLAKESEFKGFYRDCETGAIPPLGPLFGQRVFVDRTLTGDPEVVFSGGSHREAIRMPYNEFARIAGATVATFARGPALASVSASRAMAMIVTDPVCGVELARDLARAHAVYHGEAYYFCSLSCEMAFDDNPDGYIRERERERER
jgi:Ala-tRNA(Pro) deacylase